MKTHLQTAHERGVQAALEKCGYASVDEVRRDIADLGLNKTAEAQQPTPAPSNYLAALKAKLSL